MTQELCPTQGDGEVAELVAALSDPCIAPLLRERIRAALAQPEPAGEVSDEDVGVDLDKVFYQHAQRQDENFQPLMDVQSFSEACAAIDLARSRRAPVPVAEALAARPLLEQVARMGDRIGQHTVAEIMVISDRAAAWLRENPPGQPVAVEPRGGPMPGACACVEPAPPTEGEVAELVEWLHDCANVRMDEGYERPAFKFARAADLLQHLQPPQSVLVSERLQQMEDLAGDAVSALRYIEAVHGRLYGVGWNRVYEKADRLQPSQAMPIPPSEND
jgi:hypothetical protein